MPHKHVVNSQNASQFTIWFIFTFQSSRKGVEWQLFFFRRCSLSCLLYYIILFFFFHFCLFFPSSRFFLSLDSPCALDVKCESNMASSGGSCPQRGAPSVQTSSRSTYLGWCEILEKDRS